MNRVTDPTPNPSPTREGNGHRLAHHGYSAGTPLPCRGGVGGGVSNRNHTKVFFYVH